MTRMHTPTTAGFIKQPESQKLQVHEGTILTHLSLGRLHTTLKHLIKNPACVNVSRLYQIQIGNDTANIIWYFLDAIVFYAADLWA